MRAVLSPTPPRTTDLNALAAIWVERWLKYGGALIVDDKADRLSLSMRVLGRQSIWRSRHPTTFQRNWHDGWAVGRWRELNDLAELIPGMTGAIIDHVVDHGEPQPHGGWQMITPHPWDSGKEAA